MPPNSFLPEFVSGTSSDSPASFTGGQLNYGYRDPLSGLKESKKEAAVAKASLLKARQRRQQIADDQYLTDRDATTGEAIGDALTGLSTTTVDIAGSVYAAADFASREANPINKLLDITGFGEYKSESLDEALGWSTKFGEVRQETEDALMSDHGKRQQREFSKEQSVAKASSDKKVELLRDRDPSFGNFLEMGATQLFEDVKNTAAAYAKHPRLALNEAVGSLPYMLTGAGLARGVLAKATKGMTAAEAAAFKASAAGEKVGRAAATANIVGLEGFGNSGATQADILNMSEADLMKGSDPYRKLRDKNISHKAAQRIISNQASNETLAYSMPLAFAATKLTSADKIQAKAGVPSLGSNIPKKVAEKLSTIPKAGGSEAIEEIIQSGGGQAIQNAATQKYADSSVSVGDNVGSAIVSGALTGGLSGAALSTPGAVVDAIATGIDESKKITDGIRHSVRVEKAVAHEDPSKLAEILDKNHEDYNTLDAVKASIHPTVTEKLEGEELQQQIATAEVLLEEYIDQISTAADSLEEGQEVDEAPFKELAAMVEKINHLKAGSNLTKEGTTVDEIQDDGTTVTVNTKGIDDSLNILDSVDSTQEQNVQAADTVRKAMVRAPDTVDLDKLEKAANSTNFDKVQKAEILSFIKTRKAQKEVFSDVTEGSKDFRGINNHLSLIGTAIESNDSTKAASSVAKMVKFKEAHQLKADRFDAAINVVEQIAVRSDKTPTEAEQAILSEVTDNYTTREGKSFSFKQKGGWTAGGAEKILLGEPKLVGNTHYTALDENDNKVRKQNGIVHEVAALNAAIEEGQLRINNKFPGTYKIAPATKVKTQKPVSNSSPKTDTTIEERNNHILATNFVRGSIKDTEEYIQYPDSPTENLDRDKARLTYLKAIDKLIRGGLDPKAALAKIKNDTTNKNAEAFSIIDRDYDELYNPDGKAEQTTLQQRTTAAIQAVSKGTTADKAGHTKKELIKSRQATQFIGEGKKGSSTDRYNGVYKAEGKSNTGSYESSDIVFVASNGNRGGAVKPVIDGKLQGAYQNIDKAIAAGAKIVMDTRRHITNTKNYNLGEISLAKYIQSKGYTRDDSSGAGVWSPAVTTNSDQASDQATSKSDQAPVKVVRVNTLGTKANPRLAQTNGTTIKVVNKLLGGAIDFYEYFKGNNESETSQQKKKTLDVMATDYGITIADIEEFLGRDETKIAEFLIGHETSHITNNDKLVYFNGDYKDGVRTGTDWLTDDKIEIEVRATLDALRGMGFSVNERKLPAEDNTQTFNTRDEAEVAFDELKDKSVINTFLYEVVTGEDGKFTLTSVDSKQIKLRNDTAEDGTKHGYYTKWEALRKKSAALRATLKCLRQ